MGIRGIRPILLPLVLLISSIVTAQEPNKRFRDEEVLFKTFKTTYEYVWDEVSQRLKVKIKDEVKLTSNKASTFFSWPVGFNDQIVITDFRLENERGRKESFTRICGHIEQSGIFYSDAKLCTFSFDFNLKNSTLTLTNERVIDDPRYFTRIDLQTFIPGEERVVEIFWPTGVDVELIDFNFSNYAIESSELISGTKKGIRYRWEWAEAFEKDVDNKPSMSYYSPHIIPVTKSFIHPSTNEKVLVLETVDNLYDWYKTLVGNTSNNTQILEPLVEDLTEGKSDPEKIRSIYYWVQDNIKYVAFEDGIMGFKPDDAQSVYQKKYGDCKGMANLLKNMLNIAGFDARLSWLGTNHIPYSYEIPSLVVDNHMICSILKDDDIIFLDPTAKYNDFGYIPGHIQGKEIMIEAGDDYIISEIPVEKHEQNFESVNVSMHIRDGELKTKGTVFLEGDSKQYFLYAINNLWVEFKDRFTRKFIAQNANPKDFDFTVSEAHRDSTVSIDFINTSDGLINEYGEELYVQMDIRNELTEMKLDDKRKTHYYFGSRKHIVSRNELTIPEGYQATYIPESIQIEEDQFSMLLQYEVNAQKVTYSKEITVHNAILSPEHFSKWNEAIDRISEFYRNPIILSK